MEEIKNQPIKSKRDLFLERLRAKYPEEAFDDDEAIYGRIIGDYDDYDKKFADYDERIKGYEDDQAKMVELMTKEPRAAAWLNEWKHGEDPSIALIRMYGDDLKDIIDDPEKQKEVAEANREYAERVAKNKDLEKEYYENLQTSLELIDKLKDEYGMTDDEFDEVFSVLIGVAKDALVGKFTPEAFEMCRKGLNHDNDVVVAGEEGEVRGRNAKIDDKLKMRKKGDGMASFGGNSGGAEPSYKQRDLGALNRYDDGLDDIWSRGGEKRTKHNNF